MYARTCVFARANRAELPFGRARIDAGRETLYGVHASAGARARAKTRARSSNARSWDYSNDSLTFLALSCSLLRVLLGPKLRLFFLSPAPIVQRPLLAFAIIPVPRCHFNFTEGWRRRRRKGRNIFIVLSRHFLRVASRKKERRTLDRRTRIHPAEIDCACTNFLRA